MAKHHVAAGTNSPSTTNEKRTIQAQRDFLKREQPKPEHKAPKRYVEVGMNSLHRIQAVYIPISPRQQICPAAADPPKGSGEVLERDRGSKSPVSLQPPPRGVNKIYKCDMVFPPGEARTETISQTQFPFTPPRGVNKIYTYDVVFFIGEANTIPISQTQIP